MQDQRQRKRWAWTHRYAVPMFMSSLVAVVLAGSGLVGVMVFAGGDGSRENGGGDGSGEQGFDSCVLGTWRVVSYREQTQLGSAEMIEGEPAFSFQEDGTGLADFDGTRMASDVLGQEAEISGQITYRYETSDQTFEFVEQDSQAGFSSDIDILGLGDDLEFTLPSGPLDYTCDGDAMTITGEEQAFEYQRAGS
jgi:hypothetical protein